MQCGGVWGWGGFVVALASSSRSIRVGLVGVKNRVRRRGRLCVFVSAHIFILPSKSMLCIRVSVPVSTHQKKQKPKQMLPILIMNTI